MITLPRNAITLYGNESTDDHEPLNYEWSLSPQSKAKVVEMQVSGQREREMEVVGVEVGERWRRWWGSVVGARWRRWWSVVRERWRW